MSELSSANVVTPNVVNLIVDAIRIDPSFINLSRAEIAMAASALIRRLKVLAAMEDSTDG